MKCEREPPIVLRKGVFLRVTGGMYVMEFKKDNPDFDAETVQTLRRCDALVHTQVGFEVLIKKSQKFEPLLVGGRWDDVWEGTPADVAVMPQSDHTCVWLKGVRANSRRKPGADIPVILSYTTGEI